MLTTRNSSLPVLRATGSGSMVLSGRAASQDPVASCLRTATPGSPWAALGINFSDRDRVLASGAIRRAQVAASARGGLDVDADLSFTEGGVNCPKYIPIFDVQLKSHEPASDEIVSVVQHSAPAPAAMHGGLLPSASTALCSDAKELVTNAESFFLGTRHAGVDSGSASMHLNFRGGPRGFVRVGAGGSTLAWPDYSGNRKYTSLGNIESDGVAGLVFIDWSSGDALYVTGTAVVLTGDAAAALIPRSVAAVEVTVTAQLLLRGAIAVSGGPTLERSPYNPPVRPLAEELALSGRLAPQGGPGMGAEVEESSTIAEVISASSITPDTATFSLRLRGGKTLMWQPGQYVVLDFKRAFPPAPGHPKRHWHSGTALETQSPIKLEAPPWHWHPGGFGY